MSNQDIGRVWAARDAAEATERALRDALSGWERRVTSDHFVWTLAEPDGTWTVRVSTRSPQVAVYQPCDIPGAPLARLTDLSPHNVEAVLVALGVPEVGAGVLVS